MKGIREFIAIVESGSFTEAAETLNLTRPRTSQILTELEQRLGVELIKRSTRTLQVTSTGERFYQQCVRSIAILDAAVAQAREDLSSISGKIRINSVGGMFGEEILAPLLLDFKQDNPFIEIELDFDSVQVDIISEPYDIAIRMGELADSSFIGRHLTSYKTYVCASPEYLEKYGKVEHPSQIKDREVIMGSVKYWKFTGSNNGISSNYEVGVKGRFYCPNGYVARTAAINGHGIVRLPEYYAREPMRNGQLVNVLEGWTILDSKVSAVYPASRHKSKKLATLVDYLVQRFQ